MTIRELFPGIVSHADIFGGAAIIQGTRMPVAMVVDHLAEGMPLAELLDEYDLTAEEVRQAVAYAEHIPNNERGSFIAMAVGFPSLALQVRERL